MLAVTSAELAGDRSVIARAQAVQSAVAAASDAIEQIDKELNATADVAASTTTIRRA